jgi:hypothetical protein
MARRKKAAKKVSYKRRRSVGAMGANVLTDIAGVVAGALIAKQLNKVLKFDAKILAAGKIALGVALPKFMKNPLMNGIGQGMIAIGGTELVGAFVPALGATDDLIMLSGTDDDFMSGLDTIGEDGEMNGFDVSEVNGFNDISEVNGFDEM